MKAISLDFSEGCFFKKSLRGKVIYQREELENFGFRVNFFYRNGEMQRLVILKQGSFRRYIALPIFAQRAFQKRDILDKPTAFHVLSGPYGFLTSELYEEWKRYKDLK